MHPYVSMTLADDRRLARTREAVAWRLASVAPRERRLARTWAALAAFRLPAPAAQPELGCRTC